jgi:hypothetical protein
VVRATREAMSPGRCLAEIKEVIFKRVIAMRMLQNDGELELVANSRFPRVMSRPNVLRRTTMASTGRTHGCLTLEARGVDKACHSASD